MVAEETACEEQWNPYGGRGLSCGLLAVLAACQQGSIALALSWALQQQHVEVGSTRMWTLISTRMSTWI